MTATTMAVQADARGALSALLSHDFEGLPAADIQLSTVYPNRIKLTLYAEASTFADFEVWREALRIPADEVDSHTFGQTLALEATGALLGSTVALVAYGPLLPVTASDEVRAS
jgi:hypothetical protein